MNVSKNSKELHSICFSTDTGETKMMSKFSSLKFLETFTKSNLSVEICASRLQSVNYAYDNIVDIVNSEGGWTVYVWVKRGFIKDASILGNDIKETGNNKVLYQDISNHVVNLHLPKKDYLDLSTIHGRYLDNLKFDFSTL